MKLNFTNPRSYKVRNRIGSTQLNVQLFIPFFSLVFILSGCSTTKKVTTIEYIHDTIKNTEYINKVLYDSIYIHDSIYTIYKNDTMYITKFKDVYKYKYIHDTIQTSDTVIVYQTKEKEVEKTTSNSTSSFLKRLLFTLFVILTMIFGSKYLIKQINK